MDARVVANDVVSGQREGVASLQLDSILRKRPDADLRSRQIPHDGYSPPSFLRRRSNVLNGSQMISEIAVREVEPSDVHSRTNHLLESRARTGGRTDRGHDFSFVKREGHKWLLSANGVWEEPPAVARRNHVNLRNAVGLLWFAIMQSLGFPQLFWSAV